MPNPRAAPRALLPVSSLRGKQRMQQEGGAAIAEEDASQQEQTQGLEREQGQGGGDAVPAFIRLRRAAGDE